MTKRKAASRPRWRRADLDINTKEGKSHFVSNLFDSIRDEVIEKIMDGRIPDHWQGHELRYLIAQKFQHEVTTRMRDGRLIQRKRCDEEIAERWL